MVKSPLLPGKRSGYLVAALLVFIGGGQLGWSHDYAGVKKSFESMHARIEIQIPESSGSADSPMGLAAQAEAVIRKSDRLFNPYSPDSDLGRLNRAPAGQWIKVDSWTMILVREARRWHELTGGRFDPTIGPLKQLFKFDGRNLQAWPAADQVAEARRKVGLNLLRVDLDANSLSWAEEGCFLDLSALAKGFAADLAAETLRVLGVENALVNVGGEMRVLGRNSGSYGGPWQVGLTDPKGGMVNYLAELSDRAMASSGNYESYFEYEGRRYSHIIDPLTATPLADRVAGVVVIHPERATEADALATVLSLLGPEEGRAFLEREAQTLFPKGVEVIMFLTGPGRELEALRMSLAPDGRLTLEQP